MAISASKDFIVFPNDNSSRVTIKETTFLANGTWTAPTGVTSAQVVLVGGGGGGGGGSDIGAGGGGAGGAVVVKNVDVTPGTTYSINVGAGGQGGQGALTGISDYVNTLPGGNGGTTTFGNITIANYLTNSNYDYSFAQWDGDVAFRYATGASGASSITVFPNAQGLTAGMLISGTNVGTNAQIVSVSGNVVTVNVVNAGAINTVIRFDQGTTTVKQGSVMYNNVSNGTYLSNAMGINQVCSPNTQFLSNNLLMPQVAQLEDPSILTSNYLRVYGTNPATLSVTNAGMPGKLAEMQVPLTRVCSAALSSITLTVSDTTNLAVGMFVVGAGIGTGCVILSVDSLTQVTLSVATTNTLSSQVVTFSYTGTYGLNALSAATGAAVSTSNPTWINWSNLNNTTNVTASAITAGFSGVAYQPGQTYTLSMYVSSSVNVSSSTPILFQLKSSSGSGSGYMAQSNTNYQANTSTGTTSSIDAGTANGFFVRQVTPTPLAGYGGTVTVNGTAANNSTTVTVADASQILIGMSITGTGMPASVTVSGVSGNTLTISSATTAAITSVPLTFATPTGVQMLGSNVTIGQTGWRRMSATFSTPSFSATTANGVFGYGTLQHYIYPCVVLQQPSTTFWFDNVQLEVGGSATTYQQPLYAFDNVLNLQTASTAGSNLEVGHRFIKSIAGNTYTGSVFVLAGGSANQYRPVQGFIEYFDKDYNSLGRSLGLSNVLPNSGISSGTTTSQQPATSYPVRVGVSALAPTGTAWMRFGVTVYQGAQNGTGSAMEHYLMYPQLELAATATILKRPNDGTGTYVYAGQPGMSPIITAATVSAEGGGGGGTYNTNVSAWLYGLEGANNGGHAAGASGTSSALPVLAGGGGGAGGAGGNGYMYVPAPSNSTTYSYAGGWNSTVGSAFQSYPMRGNPGGAAVWQTSSAGGVANMPGYAGDGGPGLLPSGLNSGSAYGIPLGGGGGGAGWTGTTQFVTVPGRGQAGGGKGGGTWLTAYNSTQSAGAVDYYARGLDGLANTGGGGGGGGGNLAGSNTPQTTRQHASAGPAVGADSVTQDAYKWTSLYNATVTLNASANIAAGSAGLQVVIQDVGNAKITTAWQAFPILNRTALVFPIVAARLVTAPSGITSTNFAGLPKRVRPTIRWKNYQGALIREDRPAYDIQFTALSTTNYLAATSGSTVASGWQTVPAPDNAAYFDVCWELLYFDAGDVVYLDISDCQYYAYQPTGGNGGDGVAIIRYFDKAVI